MTYFFAILFAVMLTAVGFAALTLLLSALLGFVREMLQQWEDRE